MLNVEAERDAEEGRGDGDGDLFGTPTMAELFAAQGRFVDAIAIYRKLIAHAPDHDRAAELTERLRRLERAQAHAVTGASRAPTPPRAVSRQPVVPARAPGPVATPAVKLPLLVTEPVRSGQVIHAHERDLVVLAAVNPGAQLVADGNIHAYGTLRGRAIAGASGCREARIFCQRLEAELVGVAGLHLAAEDLPSRWLGRAVQVLMRDGALVFAPLP